MDIPQNPQPPSAAPQIPPPPSAPPVATASPQPIADAPLGPGEARVWSERPVEPRRAKLLRRALAATVLVIVAGAAWAAGWWALPIPIGFTDDTKTPIFIWLKARRGPDGSVMPGLVVDEASLNRGVAERYGDNPAYKNKLVKTGMMAAFSGLRYEWFTYREKTDELGFCAQLSGKVKSQIEENLNGEDRGLYEALGITIESYPIDKISCSESSLSFVATVSVPLEDGTWSSYCVSSDGGSGLGKVATFDSGCGETYETPTALPGTPEYQARAASGGGAAAFLPPSPVAAAPSSPVIVPVNFPAVLYEAEALGWQFRHGATSHDGFCESEIYRVGLAAPLAEWGTSVECVDAPTKFAVAVYDADLGITACADWTGYARRARGIVDASCDFIDAPEPGEARP